MDDLKEEMITLGSVIGKSFEHYCEFGEKSYFTINHQPSTINHQPSTINHQPSTIN